MLGKTDEVLLCLCDLSVLHHQLLFVPCNIEFDLHPFLGCIDDYFHLLSVVLGFSGGLGELSLVVNQPHGLSSVQQGFILLGIVITQEHKSI
jgi:hypothetical protein